MTRQDCECLPLALCLEASHMQCTEPGLPKSGDTLWLNLLKIMARLARSWAKNWLKRSFVCSMQERWLLVLKNFDKIFHTGEGNIKKACSVECVAVKISLGN